MNDKEYTWHKIADSINEISFNDNNLAETSVGGKSICLIKKENILYACTHKCPHAGGRMVDGYLDIQSNIVCPLHRYRFNVENGRNTSGEGYYLKTYLIENREDGLYIGFEKNKGIFGW